LDWYVPTSYLSNSTIYLSVIANTPDNLIVSNCQHGSKVCALLTHLSVTFHVLVNVFSPLNALHSDAADIGESWSFPGNRSDVLRIVEGWDARCAAILSKAPAFVDWKLVYRAPLPTWVSSGGRLALIGDAAHPFLPTSVQGASQAVEDGVALAAALQLGGKDKVPDAVRAWEYIRYKRVRYAQILGETTRNKWHRATLADRGEKMNLPTPEWLLDYDVERYVYQNFEAVRSKIEQDGYSLPKLPEDEECPENDEWR